MYFNLLPPEIHLEIISYLDYESLRSLTFINKRVGMIITRNDIYSALVRLEKNESRADRVKRRLFPCYGCLKLLPWGYYGGQETRMELLGGSNMEDRRCYVCKPQVEERPHRRARDVCFLLAALAGTVIYLTVLLIWLPTWLQQLEMWLPIWLRQLESMLEQIVFGRGNDTEFELRICQNPPQCFSIYSRTALRICQTSAENFSIQAEPWYVLCHIRVAPNM